MWNFAPAGQNYARSRGASLSKSPCFFDSFRRQRSPFRGRQEYRRCAPCRWKADGRGRDALIEELFLGELCVRRGRRMDDEGLHVRDICKQRENFEVINEAERGFLPALDLEGKDARAAVREIPLVERVVGVIGKRGMVDFATFGWFFRNSTTFFVFSACRSRRRDSVSVPCKEQKRCERRDGRAPGRAAKSRAHRSQRPPACRVDERHAVIAGVRVRDQRELLPLALQSNLPASTITPPSVVPWPPMNFVAEWTTMSAPCSMGRMR